GTTFATFATFSFLGLPLSGISVQFVVLRVSFFSRNEPPNPAKYSSERPEMTSHDGKSRKATRKTKSTKGTKYEITQILQTQPGDHPGNRTRVAAIRPARRSWLHCNPAASRTRCRRDRKRSHQLDWTDFLSIGHAKSRAKAK